MNAMRREVRTTVTLDDDLADILRRRAGERNVPFEQMLNEAIRVGLVGGMPRAKPYRMKPRTLGVRAGVDLTKALALASALEDAEIVRELEQGR